jgi:polysaccharide deacetylase family protein (PEP-CTERM system associated)
MTCDLEEWYHGQLSGWDERLRGPGQTRVAEATRRVLELLDRFDTRITFFVLGCVAERHPELIGDIRRRGHEIACHGYSHGLAHRRRRAEFEADLDRALAVLRAISGTVVRGYRAPSWSLRRDMEWAFEALYARGIRYDSSLFPFKTFLYGDSRHPRHVHAIRLAGGRTLHELPPSVIEVAGLRMPFSGGFYLRALPYPLVRLFFKFFERGGPTPAVVYFHPWELDRGQPRVAMPLRDRLIQTYGLSACEQKLARLLKAFDFCPAGEYLNL